MNIDEKVLVKAIDFFGPDRQKRKAYEEMAELQVAMEHFADGKATVEEVTTEIADVLIIVSQLAIIFGKEQVEKDIKFKMKRLEGICKLYYDR